MGLERAGGNGRMGGRTNERPLPTNVCLACSYLKTTYHYYYLAIIRYNDVVEDVGSCL